MGWFWAHHSPDAEGLAIKLIFLRSQPPCFLHSGHANTPLFSYLPGFPYSHPISGISTWAIKIQPVLRDLRQMPLKKKK